MSQMENLGSDRQKVIEELTRGRDVAKQLKQILSDGGSTAKCAEDLAFKIMTSFTKTLLALHRSDQSEAVSQMQLADSCHRTCPNSEDSQESCRSTSAVKDPRGCYKRRRTSHTWQRDTTAQVLEDGRAWRKYGQKVILNTKHPRSYYRCTHKNDQGCQATKHVQQIQDDPPLYRTTYYGHHTCKDLLKAPQLILDVPATDSSESGLLLSFENHMSAKQDDRHLFFSSLRSIKGESENSNVSDHGDQKQSQTSSSNYILNPPTDALTALSSHDFTDLDDFQQYFVFDLMGQ